MKTIFLACISILSISILITSCKKNSNQNTTTAQKLQYKWTLVNAIDNDHYSGVDHSVTVNGNTGDYMDFKSNGKVYINFQSQKDSSTYALLGDTKIIFDGTDTALIKTLTSSNLQLYFKDIYSAPDYEEVTYNLSK